MLPSFKALKYLLNKFITIEKVLSQLKILTLKGGLVFGAQFFASLFQPLAKTQL